MRAVKARLQDAARMRDLTDRLPRKPQQVAENYNHLMEQPTIAYAVGLMLAVLGDQAAWAVSLAWGAVRGWTKTYANACSERFQGVEQ